MTGESFFFFFAAVIVAFASGIWARGRAYDADEFRAKQRQLKSALELTQALEKQNEQIRLKLRMAAVELNSARLAIAELEKEKHGLRVVNGRGRS